MCFVFVPDIQKCTRRNRSTFLQALLFPGADMHATVICSYHLPAVYEPEAELCRSAGNECLYACLYVPRHCSYKLSLIFFIQWHYFFIGGHLSLRIQHMDIS